MKKTRYTEQQIIGALKQMEAGRKVADLARELGVSEATICTWKSKFGGLEVSEAQPDIAQPGHLVRRNRQRPAATESERSLVSYEFPASINAKKRPRIGSPRFDFFGEASCQVVHRPMISIGITSAVENPQRELLAVQGRHELFEKRVGAATRSA